MGLEFLGHRSRPFTPMCALEAKFYVVHVGECMEAKFPLWITAGLTKLRLRMWAVVG